MSRKSSIPQDAKSVTVALMPDSLTLQGGCSDDAAAMTLEEFAGQQSTPSKAGADNKPKKSTHRYVIEVRTAQGQSLVLTTVDWTTDDRRNAINQICAWRVSQSQP